MMGTHNSGSVDSYSHPQIKRITIMYNAFIVQASSFVPDSENNCVRGYAQISVDTARDMIGALESAIWSLEHPDDNDDEKS